MTTEFQPTPFTLVYDALMDMALQSDAIRRLVKPGNRISYGSATDRDPIKDQVQAADMPELVLLPMGVSGGNLHSNSSTSKISRSYAFVITTGDYRLHPFLHQIEWQLVCALANWKSNLAMLAWNGETNFVKNANLLGVTENTNDMIRNRGIAGWSAAWMCYLEMHLNTAKLVAALKEGELL